MIRNGFNIPTITDIKIENKKVFVRADFDVSMIHNKIADDTRIKKSIPTIEYLLKNKNKLILVSKLNRPDKRDKEHSLIHIIPDLEKYLPNKKIIFIEDFLDTKEKSIFENQKENEIILL